MSLAYAGADLAPYGRQLQVRAQVQDGMRGDANAWMDLATILQLTDRRDLGLAAQAQALALGSLYHLPAPAGVTGVRLLALMAPGDFMTNTPLDFLLEDSDVALDMLYVGPDLPLPATLPPHDVLFVAIGESARTQPLLAQLAPVVATWPRPVLNRPEMIAHSARDCACGLLAGTPGLLMPTSVALGRTALAAVDAAALATLLGAGDAAALPFIARPRDAHAGKGLARLDGIEAIAGYLQQTPGDDFFLSPFVDYRSADGRYRKFRVALIAGRPYAVHMAISEHWIVHYLNAGMSENADKRREEARFMEDFDAGFGRRHAPALQCIAERLALDYLVIDCAETRDGRLLVFEVDPGAVVHLMDPPDVFPYKAVQMRKVFAAFREMLLAAAR